MITLNRQHLKALHVKEEQLQEKEKMIDLLKVKNERLGIFNDEMNERLTTTVSSLNQTLESVNQYRDRMEIMKNIVILREAQIQQVAEDKGPIIQRLHEIINEKKKLNTHLRHATLDVHLLNRKFNHPMMCLKETSNDELESNKATAIVRTERDIIVKRCEDLSVNSQAVTKELNDITNKYHQTLQHLESFTTKNKFLEENLQKMNMYYSRVSEERNELWRLLSETTRQLKDKSNTSVWSGGDNCVMIKFEETTSHSSQQQCDRDSSSPQLCVTSSFDLSVKDNIPPTDYPATPS
ncbi:uncharacterized protein MCAP_0864-like isoform X2 [Dysidea avara]